MICSSKKTDYDTFFIFIQRIKIDIPEQKKHLNVKKIVHFNNRVKFKILKIITQ